MNIRHYISFFIKNVRKMLTLLIGVSIAGGVFHNVGQLIIASLIVETFSVMYYFPVLLVAGLVTGLLIGIASDSMLKRLANLRF